MASSKTLNAVYLSITLLLACSNHPSLNKNFATNLSKARSIAVMKPNIEFYFKYDNKDKAKPEYDGEVGKNVQDAIASVLNDAGVKVISPILTDSLLSANGKLAANLERAQQNFMRVCGAIGNSESGSKFFLEGNFSEFGREIESDYLIFVKGWSYQKPRTARNVILQMNTIGYSRNQLNGLFLEIGVIEVHSGEIVWFNRNHDIESDYDPLHFESVEILCEKLLKSLCKT